MRKGIMWAVVGMMIIFNLIACSGGGGGGAAPCAAPALDATGTWCISITNISGTCGNTNTTPYAAVFTQSASNVSVTSQGGNYTGTVCGNTGTVTGTNFGFNTTTNFTFSDANHATATTSYSNAICSGTDTSTAVKGTCP